MATYSITSLITALLCFSLAHFAILKNFRCSTNKIVSLLCLNFALWSLFEYSGKQQDTMQSAFFWHLLYAFPILSLSFYAHFIIALTGKFNKRLKSNLILGNYVISILVITATIFLTDLLPVRYSWGWGYSKPHTLLIQFSAIWQLFLLISSLFIVILHFRTTNSNKNKKQLIYVFVGTILLIIQYRISQWLNLHRLNSFFEIVPIVFAVASTLFIIAIYQYRPFSLSAEDAAGIIVKTMSDALIVVNMDRKIEVVNSAALQMLGYTEQELLNKRPEVIIGQFQNENESVTNLLKSGIINDVQTYFRKKDGGSIPISLSWSVLRDNDQKLIGIVFIGRNMSEREKTQKALQNASNELEKRIEERTQELQLSNEQLHIKIIEKEKIEEQLSAEKEWLAVTLRSIGDGVITTDSHGKVTSMNPAGENLTGWSQKDAIGKEIDKIYNCRPIDDNNEHSPQNTLLTLIKQAPDQPLNSQSIIISNDDIKFTVAEHIAPIIDQNTTKIGYVIVVRNITEKAMLENELFRARKLESINLLAGGIAHDFNNLLTSIITNLFMAKMELPSNGETALLITNAEKAAFRASNLTKQLLVFSQGKIASRERYSIKEIIENSVGFFLSESKSDYKLELCDNLWDVLIDRGQIDKVLSNIIDNADQAMPNGGTIALKAYNTEIAPTNNLPIKSGHYVCISIADEGAGIEENLLQKIFDPYFTTREDSNGLGLTTAFVIVQQHGGHITVESIKKQGTLFTIYLPAVEDSVLKDDFNGEQPDGISGRILLMDDEEIIRISTKRVLNHLGYDVALAENGEQVIQLLKDFKKRNTQLSAIILDLTVHGGKGAIEIIDDIRTITPETKVIVSSGYANNAVITKYQEHGFHAAITKPYAINNLADVLHNLLESSDADN